MLALHVRLNVLKSYNYKEGARSSKSQYLKMFMFNTLYNCVQIIHSISDDISRVLLRCIFKEDFSTELLLFSFCGWHITSPNEVSKLKSHVDSLSCFKPSFKSKGINPF